MEVTEKLVVKVLLFLNTHSLVLHLLYWKNKLPMVTNFK